MLRMVALFLCSQVGGYVGMVAMYVGISHVFRLNTEKIDEGGPSIVHPRVGEKWDGWGTAYGTTTLPYFAHYNTARGVGGGALVQVLEVAYVPNRGPDVSSDPKRHTW